MYEPARKCNELAAVAWTYPHSSNGLPHCRLHLFSHSEAVELPELYSCVVFGNTSFVASVPSFFFNTF